MIMQALRYKAKQGLAKTISECMDQISKGKFSWWQGYYLLRGRVTALSELGLIDTIEANEMLQGFYALNNLYDQGGMGYEEKS